MTRTSVPRLPLVLVLVIVAIVAIIAGNADPDPAPAAAKVDQAATLPTAGTRSSAWFCAGLPAAIPLEEQTLTVSNVGTESGDAIVTVLPDDGSPALAQTIATPAGSVSRVPRAQLGPAGGLSVEAFSRDVAVEFGAESPSDLALGPCASAANAEWYFAAGTTGNYEANTTGRPVEEWLILFNPFGTDARVDVTLRTNAAVPEQLAPIDVPRRMRVLVPIHEETVRTAQVAVAVHATVGRVVAEQSMIFGPSSGYTGLTSSLGAVAPAPVWTFADGSATPGTRTVIAVANPGVVDTEVDVIVTAAATPLTVPLKRDAVVWIQIGGCGDPPVEGCVAVPDDAPYAASIVTDADTPVVAEQFAFYASDTVGEGVATMMGSPVAVRQALLAHAGVAPGRTAVIAVANPGAVAATVSVGIVRGGATERPPDMQDVAVGPGQRVEFSLTNALGGTEGAVVVDATGPVVVGRSLYSAGDISRSEAIVGGP
jgi:hypothetical protein